MAAAITDPPPEELHRRFGVALEAAEENEWGASDVNALLDAYEAVQRDAVTDRFVTRLALGMLVSMIYKIPKEHWPRGTAAWIKRARRLQRTDKAFIAWMNEDPHEATPEVS